MGKNNERNCCSSYATKRYRPQQGFIQIMTASCCGCQQAKEYRQRQERHTTRNHIDQNVGRKVCVESDSVVNNSQNIAPYKGRSNDTAYILKGV